MNFAFKTAPLAHQLRIFDRTKDTPRRMAFWDQGTGKTKLVIDTAAYLFCQEKINAMLVVAPDGVHRNWISDEIPKHLMSAIRPDCYCFHSSKAGTKGAAGRLMEFLRRIGQPGALSVLTISYDGFLTKAGRAAVDAFLQRGKVLYVLDEIHRIKNHSAKRTKAILSTVNGVTYRRGLTGTPIANSPFDAYSVMRFLDLGFWKPYRLDSWTIFKHNFGIWKKLDESDDSTWAPSFCVAHKNLEELNGILKKHSDRVLKDDVLDLPPKVYTRRYFQLNSEQQRVYREIRDDFMTYLNEGADMITAPLVIQRMVRLQQITSGYLPCEGGDPVVFLGEQNPRIDLLQEVMEDVPGKSIIFCKFTKDIEAISKMLQAMGRKPVTYYGKTDTDQRAANLKEFKEGDATDFVAQIAAACEGLTLIQADTVIYYNNSYNLTHRLQSEDRAHRIGQTKTVTYIDLAAEGTVDEGIVEALVSKKLVSDMVLGDGIKKWL